MSTPSPKLAIPDRAIASVIFGCFSIFTLRVFAHLMWLPVQGGGPLPEQAIQAMSPILERLQIAYRLLAIAALAWCIWSWRKEWWLPAVVATLFTALALFLAFFVR
jgi:hypothetical protein